MTSSQTEAESYVKTMVQTLFKTPDNTTHDKIDGMLNLINKPEISSSKVWLNLKDYLPQDSDFHKAEWHALQKYHAVLMLGADDTLKSEIKESTDATTLDEKLTKRITSTNTDFTFTWADTNKKTGQQLKNKDLRDKLCADKRAQKELTVSYSNYIGYCPPKQQWVPATPREEKYLQHKTLKVPKGSVDETSGLFTPSAEWQSNNKTTSSSKFFFGEKNYRQVGYSSDDYVDLGYQGQMWDLYTSVSPEPTYTLTDEYFNMDGDTLTIKNYEKMGVIDRDCILEVQNGNTSNYFKLNNQDQRLGYAHITSGDTLQERTTKVYDVLIFSAKMGYSDNLEFSYDLLSTALQGANTYAQKFREMENVVRQANNIRSDLTDVENYYVGRVKDIQESYEKKKRGLVDTYNKQFLTQVAKEIEPGIVVNENYKQLKKHLEGKIRMSVDSFIEQEIKKDRTKSIKEIMAQWTLPNPVQQTDVPDVDD